MYTKTFVTRARFLLGAATVACTLFAGSVAAKDVTVAIQVSTQGLDLNQPADARELYRRLQKAANTVCSDGSRVGLRAVPDFAGCYKKALGDAVRSANRPQLTMVYLRSHTLQDAETHGIDVPVMIAAK